jgi:hypothetical protein
VKLGGDEVLAGTGHLLSVRLRVVAHSERRYDTLGQTCAGAYQSGDSSGSVMCLHRSSSPTSPVGGSSAT